MVMLRIDALHISLGARPVLHGITASIQAGEFIGVIGPNGAGKSTLARGILNLIASDSGTVTLDDQPIATMKRADIARRIAYLPQGQMVHWPLSVERLVALGRLPHLAPFSAPSSADQDAISTAMEKTDIVHLAKRNAAELSGGERARILLARALAVQAPALIVDEPLASLDPGHQLQVMELLRDQARNGALVIAVLHDLTMAARYCDRLLLLDKGHLVANGTPQNVLTEQALANVYGVTAWTGTSDTGPMIVPTARTN